MSRSWSPGCVCNPQFSGWRSTSSVLRNHVCLGGAIGLFQLLGVRREGEREEGWESSLELDSVESVVQCPNIQSLLVLIICVIDVCLMCLCLSGLVVFAECWIHLIVPRSHLWEAFSFFFGATVSIQVGLGGWLKNGWLWHVSPEAYTEWWWYVAFSGSCEI